MNKETLLQNFVCDTKLEELEDKYLSNLNIFNAIGMNSQEIKHSNFLAWLFDPKEKHSLGDFFVKAFLKEILRNNQASNNEEKLPTVFNIDAWDLSDLIIKRENCNIDILFIDKKHSFVCVIENKIKSYQRKNQLTNYKEKIDKEYPDYKYKLFLYLKPTDDEEVEKPYIYVSYNIIKDIIEKILSTKTTRISNDLQIILKHYKDLLERNIMGNPKLQEICEQIYAKHKDAINLILENVDMAPAQTQIAETLTKALEEQNFKRVKGNGSRNINFLPKDIYNCNDFCFKIWNTGGVNNRYELKVELNPEKGFNSDKLEQIKKSLSIENKKIGDILKRTSIEKICEYVDANGCLTKEQEDSLKKGLSNILKKINIEEMTSILNS